MNWLTWLPYGTLALSVAALAVSIWVYRDVKRSAQRAIANWEQAEKSWNEAERRWKQAAKDFKTAAEIRQKRP